MFTKLPELCEKDFFWVSIFIFVVLIKNEIKGREPQSKMEYYAEELISQFYAEEQEYVFKIQNLQKTQETLLDENLRLSENCASWKVKVQDLHQKLDLAKNEKVEHEKKIEDMKQTALTECETFGKKMNLLKSQVSELHKERTCLTNEKNLLEASVKNFESLNISLGSLKEEMALLAKEKVSYDEEKKTLQSEIASRDFELTLAKANYDTLLQKNADFEKQTKENDAKSVDLQEKLLIAQSAHEHCSKKKTEYTKRIEELETEKTSILEQNQKEIVINNKNFEQAKTILETECKELKKKLANAEELRKKDAEEIAELHEILERLQSDNKRQLAKIQETKEKNKELECDTLEKNQELADQVEKNKELANQVFELTSRTKTFEEELNNWKTKKLYTCKIFELNYRFISLLQNKPCTSLQTFAVLSDSSFKKISSSLLKNVAKNNNSKVSSMEELILTIDESQNHHEKTVKSIDVSITEEHASLITKEDTLTNLPNKQRDTLRFIGDKDSFTEKAIFISNPFDPVVRAEPPADKFESCTVNSSAPSIVSEITDPLNNKPISSTEPLEPFVIADSLNVKSVSKRASRCGGKKTLQSKGKGSRQQQKRT